MHLQNTQISGPTNKTHHIHTCVLIIYKCTNFPQGYSITPSEIAMYTYVMDSNYCIHVYVCVCAEGYNFWRHPVNCIMVIFHHLHNRLVCPLQCMTSLLEYYKATH